MSKHPGSIDQHGSQWRVRLSVGGKRYRFVLDGETDRADVEGFARSKYDELRTRSGRGLPGPMAFSALVTRYEDEELPHLAAHSQKSYRTSLKALRTYFVTEGGDPAAHEIRPGHIHGFMAWRRNHTIDGKRLASPVSSRTVAKDRVIAHVLFGFGERLEIVDSNPVRKTKAPKGDKREPLILSADQYEALLDACGDRPMLALYVLTLGETGVRCDSEALWLRWADVDLDRGFLTVESVRKGRRTKSGKSRKVPMTGRLRAAFREHMARYRLATYPVDTNGHVRERSPWVFHHELDRRHAKAGTRIGGLRRAFQGAAERAELPGDLVQHDLRHRRVTTLIQEGHPLALVAKMMGHSTVRVTEGYLHLVDRDLLSLVEDREDRELRALVQGGGVAGVSKSVSSGVWKTSKPQEAPPGFEPGMEDLQSSALPLGHGA